MVVCICSVSFNQKVGGRDPVSEKMKNEGCTLPINVGLLIPHRPPMLLVEELIERRGDIAKANAVMPESGIFFEETSSFPEFFIEVVAQTVAAAQGYDALVDGESMSGGMLVGIDSFTFHKICAAGTVLTISTELTFTFGAVKIIHGEIFDGDTLLAEGDIKVWENPGEE